MPDPVDIAAFILACVGEEEADAKAAPKGPWVWEAVGTSGYPQRVTNATATLIAECFENPDRPASCAEYIAQQNPAVTLAKAEMVRGVIADYEKTERLKEENAAKFSRAMREDPPDQGKIAQLKTHGWELAGRKQAMRVVVFRIASAYRLRPDGTVHPKWREEWEA